MKHGRSALFYSVLAIFVATAVIALLGITGILNVRDQYLDILFTALIIELVAAVIGLFKATDWFGTKTLVAVEEIEGYWWQLIQQNNENTMGLIRITFADAEQQVKLEGRAFTTEGLPWARFWSIAAALNATKTEVYYFWKGDHTRSDEDFSGVGFIRFTRSSDDSNKFDHGTGWFTRGDIFRADVTEKKKVIYRRATTLESEAMRSGEQELQKLLVAYVCSEWPSSCKNISLENLRAKQMSSHQIDQ